MNAQLPDHYRAAIRVVIRYAIVMVVVALLVGISFQESARKLTWDIAPAGLHMEAMLQLAVVHGHVFVSSVLLPIALLALLLLARMAGGTELAPRTVSWLTRGYLPAAAVTLALMLFKGYFILLAVRHGETDMGAIHASLLGGPGPLRYTLYGVIHGAMGLTVCVYLLGLWRSLGARAQRSVDPEKAAA